MIDCGVDLERFAPRDVSAARAEVGWSPSGTGFVCVGSLSERKNVLRLARVFERRGEGSLAFVGDGRLRPALEGRPGIRVVGPVDHDRVAAWIAAADVVCQPSLVEPFGLATLEGLASARSVVATRVGGPPEFVPPGGGVLVDPLDDDALRRRPRPGSTASSPESRGAPGGRGARRQAAGGTGGGSACFALLEIGEPELDQGPNCLLEPSCTRRLEGRQVALPHFLERHSLLEPVVAGHEEPLDRGTRVVRGGHGSPD